MRRIPTAWRRALVWAVALAAMALTASLGRWQLSRAAEKEALQAAIAERQRLPALDGASLAQALSDDQARELLHRAITLRGQWLADRTVFLDNRPMARQTGFYVLTPLRLTGSDRVVLVQRGWAPRHQVDRSLLPPVQTPTGEVQVSGRIAAHPPRVYQLGQEQGGAIRQNLDLDAWRAETGLPLAPVLVVQTGAASDGLQRDWPEAASGVEKHYGYAFQWFGMAALIVILYVWFQIVRRFLPSHQSR